MRAPRKPPAKSQKSSTLPPEPKQEETSGMPADVLEFVTALDDYKRRNQRPFQTWSEVLDIVK